MIESLFGDYKLLQNPNYFKLTTDSVFLSDFIEIAPNECAIELGTGAGALWVLAVAKNKSCRIDGIEILPGACSLAQENQILNNLQSRGDIKCADARNACDIFSAASYDVCFANPPYFDRAKSRSAKTYFRESARGGSLEDFCSAACSLLKNEGRFYFCYRSDYGEQIAQLLENHAFSLQKTVHIHSKKPVFDMFFAQKNASNALNMSETVYLSTPEGKPSKAYRKAYMLDF